MGKFQFYLQIC